MTRPRPDGFAVFPGEHGLDLGLERLRAERLDDVVVDARRARGDHVLGLRFRRHHDERRLAQVRIGAHLVQQVEAGHRLHVPVGDDEAIAFGVHLAERRGAVVDAGKTDLLQEIADDTHRGVVVVDREHGR